MPLNQEVPNRPDFSADDVKSQNVQWFLPADFDISDDSEDAKNFTGWFYRGKSPLGSTQWQGPYNTSSAAADAAIVAGFAP